MTLIVPRWVSHSENHCWEGWQSGKSWWVQKGPGSLELAQPLPSQWAFWVSSRSTGPCQQAVYTHPPAPMWEQQPSQLGADQGLGNGVTSLSPPS